MGNLGVPELLIILAIVIIIFGAGKLPQLGKGFGEGIRNFKDAMKDGQQPGSDSSKTDDSAKK